MSQKTINNSKELSASIKNRRIELGLTIEAAASKAGVGTKTWYRYETGSAIRNDKVKGICSALGWNMFPNNTEDDDYGFDLDYYKNNEAWSNYICELYGEAAAISFIIGSEILVDYINEALNELSSMPKGSHIGELGFTMLKDMLPAQFLMEYDYNFLFKLKNTVLHLRSMAIYDSPFVMHSVIEELALYLIADSAEFLMEIYLPDMKKYGFEGLEYWNDWIFDVFDDADIETCLYSDWYMTPDHNYHFSHWYENQFYMSS